jgi:hypothetical protein
MSTLPATMRAAAIDRFGRPKELSIHTLPVRKPVAAVQRPVTTEL